MQDLIPVSSLEQAVKLLPLVMVIRVTEAEVFKNMCLRLGGVGRVNRRQFSSKSAKVISYISRRTVPVVGGDLFVI